MHVETDSSVHLQLMGNLIGSLRSSDAIEEPPIPGCTSRGLRALKKYTRRTGRRELRSDNRDNTISNVPESSMTTLRDARFRVRRMKGTRQARLSSYLSIGETGYVMKNIAVHVAVQKFQDGTRAYVFLVPKIMKERKKEPRVCSYSRIDLGVNDHTRGHIIAGIKDVQSCRAGVRMEIGIPSCLIWFQVPLESIPSRLESPRSRLVNVLEDFRSRRICHSEPALLGKSLHKLVGNSRSYTSSIEEVMKLQGQEPGRPVVVELDGKGGYREFLKVVSKRTGK